MQWNTLVVDRRAWCVFVCVVVSAVGCSEDDAAAAVRLPYGANETVILGGGQGGQVRETPSGDECLALDSGSGCVQPQKVCGDGARADVVVDENGVQVGVFCYPSGDNVALVEQTDGNLKAHTAGAVIILDDKADGADIQGNVDIKADGVVLYGRGADVSVIEGNLKIQGNNVRVRGVRVKGNVEVEGDNVLIALCGIEGNLQLKKTNTVVVECDIFGNVKTDTGTNSLISNLAGGDWSVPQADNTCSGNVAFTDANADKIVVIGEIAQTLSCPTK